MNCLNCGKELVGRAKKYCNNQCQADYKYKSYIENWKAGLEDGMKGAYQLSNHIKRYLLEKTNYKCEKCGWGETNPYTNTIPLEVDHIDGNYQNNTEENLRVLCPNCHSLTPTYKGANKTGRTDRSKYTV